MSEPAPDREISEEEMEEQYQVWLRERDDVYARLQHEADRAS